MRCNGFEPAGACVCKLVIRCLWLHTFIFVLAMRRTGISSRGAAVEACRGGAKGGGSRAGVCFCSSDTCLLGSGQHPRVCQSQNTVPVAEARVAEHAAESREAVDAAQSVAAAALAAELDVARKGRADAEAREAVLQEEVGERTLF